ncbi:hypothetical protein LI177_02940 [bacterium 210820-DFI.6.37]|nr:hypothetical protein [bacterium 210820-DFI.6.37]
MAQFSLPAAPTVHTTIYNDLKGVDFSTDPSLVFKKRSPSALNMISDEGGSPKKRPGWKIEKAPTEGKETVFDGSVTPVTASAYELCRLNNISGTLKDIEMYVNGIFVKFNAFSETSISYTAKYLDSSGNLLIYVVKNKSQSYASLYIRLTGDSIIEQIRSEGSPYIVKIYRSAISGGIRDMWSFTFGGEAHLIYLIGKNICRLKDGDAILMLECESTASNVLGVYTDSAQGGAFYLLKDNELYQYINAGTENSPDFQFAVVEPYVPTLLISRSPTGGGEIYENANLLTRRRKESFLGDAESVTFYLSSEVNTDESVLVSIKDDTGALVQTTDFSVNGSAITFTAAKPPVVSGEDNVEVEYTAKGESIAEAHLKACKVATLYEHKIFLSGSTDEYGSYVWYCAYDNPAYWPDLNYLVVGSNDTNVMGLVGLGEYLGIVKEADDTNNTVYLAYATTLEDDTAYACKQSIAGVGAVSLKTFKSLNDEQLFLSKAGICGLTAEATKNRSYYINKKLLEETGLDKAIAVTWNGYYILCVNGHAYIMDSRQKTSWRTEWTNYLYECFYWDNIPAAAFTVHDGSLWFGTAEGNLCRFKQETESDCFSDNGLPIPCEWSTPFDNDNATYLFKTMTKKGGLCTIEGMENTSVDVYIRADNEEMIFLGSISASGKGVPVDFYFNKKKKKYKRLQLIFRNSKLNEGMKINEIVKSYTIGTYSKNRVVIDSAT